MVDARQALQTREAALCSAWAVYQRNVMRLSLAAICVLATSEPMRRDDGSYDPRGGLGRPLAKSTLHRWLTEAREAFRDEYIKRPIIDMIQEEDERLEHLAAEWAATAQALPFDSAKRFDALDRYLRVLESRRKLLGLDQPTKVEVIDPGAHTDPASSALAEAMREAAERRDALLARIRGDVDD